MENKLKLFKISETVSCTQTYEIVAHNEVEAAAKVSDPSRFYDNWKNWQMLENCNFDSKFKLESIGVPTKQDLADYKENQANENAKTT